MPDSLTSFFGITKPALHSTGWGPKANTDFDQLDSALGLGPQAYVAPTVGPTTTLTAALASAFAFTLNQDTTIAITGPLANPAGVSTQIWQRLRVLVIGNGVAHTITWPGNVSWLLHAPDFDPNGADMIELITRDNGTTWLGVHTEHIIRTDDLLDGLISTAKLADLSVTTDKIALAAVDTAQLKDGSVTPAKLTGALLKCRATRVTNQTIGNNVEAALIWTGSTFDNNTIHTNGSSRLTIPAAYVAKTILLMGDATWDSGGNNARLRIVKNGVTELSIVQATTGSAGTGAPSLHAVAIDDAPTAGDYYELLAFGSAIGTNTITKAWLALKEVF